MCMHIFVFWHTLCQETCSRLSAPALNSTVPSRMTVSFMKWRYRWAVVRKAKLCSRPKYAHLIPMHAGQNVGHALIQSKAQALWR